MTDVTADETSDPRRWKRNGWIARIIKNENDEGWAAEMTRVGDTEPALVSPWTMGRDKVNPKPLDHAGFATLVKGASEVLKRAEQARHAQLHRSGNCTGSDGQRYRVTLDIQPDEDDPHAILVVTDEQTRTVVRSGRVPSAFKLTEAAIRKFVAGGSD